jgi:hypothetical protein
MPKVNVELRSKVRSWMTKQAKTCSSPDVLSSLVMAHFRIDYEPAWLTKMTMELTHSTSLK